VDKEDLDTEDGLPQDCMSQQKPVTLAVLFFWAERKVSAHVNSEFGPAGGRFGGGNYRQKWMRMIDLMMVQSKFHKTIMSHGCRIHYGGLYTPPECPTIIKKDFLDGFGPVFSRLPLNHWKFE